jgi:transposase
MLPEFGGDSVCKRFSSQTNQGLISLEQMVVVVFTEGEMKDMLTCIIERGRFGGGNVMVWGGIAYGRRTQLHIIRGNLNAIRYRDEILSPHLVPFLQQHNLTLQQDNARPHVTKISTAYLQAHNIDVLPWPAFSPDLNPIEHLWNELDRRVRRRDNPSSSVPEREQALFQEWNNIPQMTVNNLINSMTRRVQSALEANGRHTRY